MELIEQFQTEKVLSNDAIYQALLYGYGYDYVIWLVMIMLYGYGYDYVIVGFVLSKTDIQPRQT